jgi:hypothetical protein
MCDTFRVAKVAATLPGYASVGRASEILHLAPRSVRDLIYTGRLPSLRVGRLHYIKSTDLELERRRRLGLPLPRRTSPRVHTRRHPARAAAAHQRVDPEVRRQRAAARAELVKHWAQRHEVFEPRVPAVVHAVITPVTCDACGREVRRGRYLELSPDPGQPAVSLCTTCARRALLEWADRRRLEAAAARRLSESLGQPEAEPVAEPDAPPELRVA